MDLKYRRRSDGSWDRAEEDEQNNSDASYQNRGLEQCSLLPMTPLSSITSNYRKRAVNGVWMWVFEWAIVNRF